MRFSGSAAALTVEAPERSDDELFDTLVERHYRRVYRLALRMVRSESDAADLTQEAFLRVYRALPKLRAEQAQSVWIRRIAVNVCLDHLRRRGTTVVCQPLEVRGDSCSDGPMTLEIPDCTDDPSVRFAGAERAELLRRGIDSLPEEYRTVIVLHHLEDISVEEIAAALNTPVGTIKSRLSRARKELRRKLCHYFDPDELALTH
jgi:RNA polymerase sigma-70 factor (ECF subfamily)